MSLNDIVNVSITAQTTAPTQVGFGTPLVCAYHTNFPERVRTYQDLSGLVTDGFAEGSDVYRLVSSVFSQNPRVSSVKVGRMATAVASVSNCNVSVVEDNKLYTVAINGTEFTYTSDATATNLEIADGLVNAINLGSEPVTALDTGIGTFSLTADVAGVTFGLKMDHHYLTTHDATTATSISSDLTAIQLENDDWYCVLLTNNSRTDINLAATWVEAAKKIMVASTSDYEVLGTGTTTNVAYDLHNASYARTALIYSGESSWSYAGAAWAGVMLPTQVGSATWKFKTLAGVGTDALTSTEVANLESNDCNYYTEIAGVNITQQGTSASGEFMDVTRLVDFITARLQEYVYSVFVNTNKVPFTDSGIATIENQVYAVMNLGISTGGLAFDPAPIVRVPKASEISFNDKATGVLVDVYFEATLAGAIHSTVMTGTLTV